LSATATELGGGLRASAPAADGKVAEAAAAPPETAREGTDAIGGRGVRRERRREHQPRRGREEDSMGSVVGGEVWTKGITLIRDGVPKCWKEIERLCQLTADQLVLGLATCRLMCFEMRVLGRNKFAHRQLRKRYSIYISRAEIGGVAMLKITDH